MPTPTCDTPRKKPRILVVTPEITYLPKGMGNLAQRLHAKAGGLADVSASLINSLYQQDADVHVALPDYRKMFQINAENAYDNEFQRTARELPEQHIHLAEDRIFYHRSCVYSTEENILTSLAFQREVINHIIPQVRPDLIHCNDWMTGLIPAFARRRGIPCLFTLHNIHTEKVSLAQIEDRGIDAADFWQHIYFQRAPYSYEETRENNPTDLLASGIFAASHVNCVSPKFLSEVIDGDHHFVPGHIRHELWAKANAGCATGILNAPDAIFDPANDPYLEHHFDSKDPLVGKAKNKALLQERLGLTVDPNAPIFFWPSRLDPVQKGTQLLAEILHEVIADYAQQNLQIAIIASGAAQEIFHRIADLHNVRDRVAVCDFSEGMSHLGYAGSDFMLMPSRFEPCGLPQMVSPKYGTLSVAQNTGGIHDTVDHFDFDQDLGNGFLFDHHTSEGLRWAIDRAMDFHSIPHDRKSANISRIMKEANSRFSHDSTAKEYIEQYEKMLGCTVTG